MVTKNNLFDTLPHSALEFIDWPWSRIEPYYLDLLDPPLDDGSLSQWLSDWTRLNELVSESYARLKVALDLNTSDAQAEAAYYTFLDGIHQASQAMEHRLKEKLLASGLEAPGLEVPLRKMRFEAEIFRQENLPLLAEERKLASRYDKIAGGQMVQWEGQELTLQQLRTVAHTPDRQVRQRAWQLASERQLADRQVIDAVWVQLLDLRQKLAENAGMPDYRAYRWRQLTRLDYTPEDCLRFQQAIEQVAVPAATRIYEYHREQLGLEAVRPWDLYLDLYPLDLPALPPYGATEDLQRTAGSIFSRVDPQLGEYFQTLRAEGYLNLENRKGKAPGAYCITFPVAKRPFLFMNAVGLADDVRTLLHESGHAFHSFERTASLPYHSQRQIGLEFAEVASMAMELLALPYLSAQEVGLYSESDSARYRINQMERVLLFWPYMAVVDAFQHWVYENPGAAADPANCDARWLELWQRFLPGVDWSGLEEAAMTGWHRKLHIYRHPFYYVEYGLAQLGAVQIWSRALQDQAQAVRNYRSALALGGTAALPQLFAAAGAKFAFDTETLGSAVALLESEIARLRV